LNQPQQKNSVVESAVPQWSALSDHLGSYKKRTHSLFRQGCMLYELIPNMPEHRLLPLMQRFAEMLAQSGLFCGLVPQAE
jgi:hypothetical protein